MPPRLFDFNREPCGYTNEIAKNVVELFGAFGIVPR
jgi:hypothetical protein